ncbi:DgyrCDS158 [Dimorphilus gyrociliatus]|uniref:Small ribosomal subunit protein uS9m n=1 Tax=Dimorphilus gyrociliatus TaxID=2664684 RepID=A0A7I8V3R7_9ANNE|nr:DgyrCDS158 [Dimorphilus gyrociliatus]
MLKQVLVPRKFCRVYFENPFSILQISLLKNTYGTSSENEAIGNAGSYKAKKISQAMKLYLENAKAHDEFLAKEEKQFEIGKRHLARIMDLDPDNISQDEIDRAIEYLFPSGLLNPKARPKLKPPSEVIPKRKAAQFDMDGRPFHNFFYTRQPNYFELLHEIVEKMEFLKCFEDEIIKSKKTVSPDKFLNLSATEWLSYREFEALLTETIDEFKYARLIRLLDRLSKQTHAYAVKDFILKYRKPLKSQSLFLEPSILQKDESGRTFAQASGSRKTAMAEVKLWTEGSGEITINNQDLLTYFPRLDDREQLIFPLLVSGFLGKVDIKAEVYHGGPSGQAGAIRLAISSALQSFVEKETIEKMRISGLLTIDPRVKERKKPGKWGARRSFTCMSLPRELPKSAKKKVKRVFANRYHAERKLGKGSFGTVWLVTDAKCKIPDEKLKVLKEISCPDMDNDETFDVDREATLLRNLNHPGIVRFHDSFLDSDCYCIVTEYCEGGDLDQKIKEYKKEGKKFPEPIVVEYLIQLLLAVQYMHGRGVMHRDLKTRNIFIKKGKLKVGDFGISRILIGTSDMASTFTGTPYYMSPEVLKHQGYNAKSDIWSIGCILYELIHLKHAFDGESMMGVMYKIVEGDTPDWSSNYSTDLRSVFELILKKNPSERPSSKELLKLPFITKQMEKIKDTIVEASKEKKSSHIIFEEQKEIAKAFKQKKKYGEVVIESEDKKMRNLNNKDRLRLKKMQRADAEAERIRNAQIQQLKDNKAQYEKVRESQNPYYSNINLFKEQSERKPVEYIRAKTASYSYNVPTRDSDDSDSSDEDTLQRAPPVFLTEPILRSQADDRPITPMKDRTVYNKEVSSLDFKDGKPDDAEMANTYYSQYEEFESDSDDENEGTLLQTVQPLSGADEDLINVLEDALCNDTVSTITLADDATGAYGPIARNQRIISLRTECIKKLSESVFNRVYAYLKEARGYGKEVKTTDEKIIMDNLSRLSPNKTRDCFLVDQLLFLEAQANLPQ